MTSALLLALLAAPLTAAPADEVTNKVAFTVARDGLKFSAPCEATAFSVDRGRDSTVEVGSVIDAELGLALAKGSYHVVIACPSSEGTFKQTFGVKVRGKDLNLPIKIAPAFLVTNVVRNGVDVPATVRIFDENNRMLAKGADKVAHPVPAGKLTVRAVVDKKAAGRRKPVRAESSIRTRAGQKAIVNLDASDGRLLLTLTTNGRKAEGIGALRRKGELERLVEVTSGAEGEVPPGTYDLVTSLYEAHDYHEIVTRNVTVQPGKLRKVKVNHPVGTLEADVRLDGKPLPEGMKADVDLFLGEAIKPFNTITLGEKATLQPGTFRVRAKVLNQKLDDRSVWEVDTKVRLRAGGASKPRLELAPARMEVTTTMGKQPMTSRVKIMLPDGKASIAKKKVGRDKTQAFALKPGRYRVVSVLKTSHGTHEVEHSVNLKKGRTHKLSLDHDLGRAVVQVFEKKIAVPARVSFVLDGAAAPALKLKAGKEAFLPPGSYTLIVHRGGKEQTFSAIKIAAGRLVERQVEFATKVKAADTAADDEPDPSPVVAPDDDDDDDIP